jgi:uncharacterized protein YqeY
MSLLETIRKDQLQSRRERCAFGTALLTTLLSEASMPGKNAGRESTDLEVLAVVKKFIDNINETINALNRNSEYHIDERVNVARLERDLLMKYVPTQKTEIELRIIISDYIEILGEKSPKQMGKIMGMLKTEYAGLYDGNLASKLVKELLQN